ncbi:MAG: hypothetical protein AAGA61_08690, partial [Pseudomonadota bacterium]
PFPELARSPSAWTDEIAGVPVRIEFDQENQTARALGPEGEVLASLLTYWFAWYAFHPDTEVYTAAPD